MIPIFKSLLLFVVLFFIFLGVCYVGRIVFGVQKNKEEWEILFVMLVFVDVVLSIEFYKSQNK